MLDAKKNVKINQIEVISVMSPNNKQCASWIYILTEIKHT